MPSYVVTNRSGSPRIIYHGRQGTFVPVGESRPVEMTADEARNAQVPGMAIIVVQAPAAPVDPAPEPPQEDDRAQLLAEARRLGLDVDGRWGVVRLRDAIARAEE